MLEAALQLLAHKGVTVGLDGLQLEDVIRQADVSRTSAYRRWPTREAFLDDVLLELARGAELIEAGARIGVEGAALLSARARDLNSPAGRYDVFVDLLRVSFQSDLEAMLDAPQFRTYLALRAAFAGVPSDEMREALAQALALSERRAVARGTVILTGACELLGLRLTGPLGAGRIGAAAIARSIAATSAGFVIAALADPQIVHSTQRVAPFGASRDAPWSIPVLTQASLVLAHIEPDPQAPPPLEPDEISARLLRLLEVGAAAAAAQ
ncbi:helix-turn-helix domain-containing protein [Cellulomonas sp. 179-A 4D5 NHS]|uniref:TetR/AcrR family transcriptional regulator n=1 Tax=Cellulomonas sp. 179-A 4D5 NHS TaxID=3142378 RepID=UPI0039A1337B